MQSYLHRARKDQLKGLIIACLEGNLSAIMAFRITSDINHYSHESGKSYTTYICVCIVRFHLEMKNVDFEFRIKYQVKLNRLLVP